MISQQGLMYGLSSDYSGNWSQAKRQRALRPVFQTTADNIGANSVAFDQGQAI